MTLALSLFAALWILWALCRLAWRHPRVTLVVFVVWTVVTIVIGATVVQRPQADPPPSTPTVANAA